MKVEFIVEGDSDGKESAYNSGDTRDASWEDTLEKSMATHSSILAWRIPWTEEPGGLQSMGPQRVGHHGSDLAHTLRDRWVSDRTRG